jgi:hypothetical protein
VLSLAKTFDVIWFHGLRGRGTSDMGRERVAAANGNAVRALRQTSAAGKNV